MNIDKSVIITQNRRYFRSMELLFFFAVVIVNIAMVSATSTRVDAIENETIVMPCSVNKSAGEKAYWYEASLNYINYERSIRRTLPNPDIAARLAVVGKNENYNLQISRVKVNDSSSYHCQIYMTDNGTNNYLRTIDYELVVYAPPTAQYPICGYQPMKPNVGDVVSVFCESRGGQPAAELSWHSDGQQLASTKDQERNLITFSKTLDEYDNGMSFMCVSESPGYIEPKSCSVTPLIDPPSVVLEMMQSKIYVNDQITFSCQGNGMPSVSYQWKVNKTIISQDTARFALNREGRELRIMGALIADNGTMVTCVVTTPTGLTASRQRMLIISPAFTSCNHDSSETLAQNQTQIPIVMIVVAYLGGVGSTLLVVLLIMFLCKKRKKYIDKKSSQVSLITKLWPSKRDAFNPTPDSTPVHIFSKESAFVTSSSGSQPPPHPPRDQLSHTQKNQYFEMSSGTFQQQPSATLPTMSYKNDYQLQARAPPPPLAPGDRLGIGYENVGRGSGTDLTDLSMSDVSESFRPPIPSASGRPPMSPINIYMEPKIPSLPVPHPYDGPSEQGPAPPRKMYDAVPNSTRRASDSGPKRRRRDFGDQPEYTEIDTLDLPQSPIRQTYEASIISNFDL